MGRRALGERELAFDYLTTPVGLRPGSSGPWLGLAGALRRQGELKQADEAFASAFAAEPTNAQILWDRAQNLRQAGNAVESKKLLRQLADSTWQPRFQTLAAQARWQPVPVVIPSYGFGGTHAALVVSPYHH